ncbi:MAG: BrnT family toxin [Terricaulis sp.]
MESEQFEWDDAKAASNEHKHGVDFWAAIKAFQDPFSLDDLVGVEDGEERYQWIGRAGDGLILVVVYTPRGERRRIISARQTTRREDDRYYRENAQD